MTGFLGGISDAWAGVFFCGGSEDNSDCLDFSDFAERAGKDNS